MRLLHRTTRRLSLTEEGQVFHARCKDVLAVVDEAEAEVTARAGEAVGQLKVASRRVRLACGATEDTRIGDFAPLGACARDVREVK